MAASRKARLRGMCGTFRGRPRSPHMPAFSANDLDHVVTSSLLSERDLAGVGGSLRHVYPLEDDHGFDQLLAQIDHADRVCRSGAGIAGSVPAGEREA